jgi:membrane-associated protease RseP (regulator of RpoE activity)
LGGLAICEDCDRDTRSQILIALAGPFAGFVFALLLLILLVVTGHGIGIGVGEAAPLIVGDMTHAVGFKLIGFSLGWQELANPHANTMVSNFLWINILWGLVNLLPIYPLDGGQISREVCQIGNPRGGVILSLQISIGAAIAMAIFGFVVLGSLFTTIMFGILAYSSYQTLQAYRQHLW